MKKYFPTTCGGHQTVSRDQFVVICNWSKKVKKRLFSVPTRLTFSVLVSCTGGAMVGFLRLEGKAEEGIARGGEGREGEGNGWLPHKHT